MGAPMADDRLLLLARRYRTTGQLEDEIAFLRAWVRTGADASRRARCAAALGDATAARLGLEPWPEAEDPWSAGLVLLAPLALRRFACDCAEQVLPRWRAHRAGDEGPRAAIAAARGFAAGEVSAAALSAAWTEVRAAWREAEAALGADAPAVCAARSACCVARGGEADPSLVQEATEHAARTARQPRAPGNPVHDWQRARLADYLLDRGTAPAEEAEPPLPTYSPRFTFGEGDRLRHPRFGEGVVRQASARQMEVEFEDGLRTLAQGR